MWSDAHNLIWNDNNQKWVDRGNDFFVQRDYDGTWKARARYGFRFPDISAKEYANSQFSEFSFATENEALAWLTQYLSNRLARLADRRYSF